MSWEPRNSIKRSISLGFALLVLSLGCSDGTSGGGGGAGGAGGAAGSTEAGTNSGGSSGSSGSNAGAGKGNPCELNECFVANTCVDHCGGSVVYTGCCACVAPAVDRNSCAADK